MAPGEAPEAGATARQMAHDERLLSRCPRSEQYSAGPRETRERRAASRLCSDPGPELRSNATPSGAEIAATACCRSYLKTIWIH